MRPLAIAAALCLIPGALAAQAQASTQPPPAPLRPYRMPQVRTTTLPNGVLVVVVERHELPIVTARLIADAGAMFEPAERSGLALLTADMLREGTATMSGPEVAARMDRLGASFVTGGSFSLAQEQITALPPVFPEAFELATETFMTPSFPASEFPRVQRIALAGYEQTMAQAEGIAPRIFQKAIYEAASPFSRSPSGSGTTLGSITRDDVVAWHRANYTSSTTVALFVGDIRFDDAVALAQRTLGRWQAGATPTRRVSTDAQRPNGQRVILVDRPGSSQSAIYVGAAGIGGNDPAMIPMTALQHVLGGGFNSRANMNLREQHGYTYGAFTDFTTLRGAGWLAIVSSVRTDATAPALSEALIEYKRIVAEDIPQEEWAAGVNNLVASFPSSVQTVQGLAERVQRLVLYGLPLDYYATYREKLAAVTPRQAQQVARGVMPVNAATIVAVGDLAEIEAPIRALNLGTVEVWDREGTRVK
ncbi:MAG: insulinase family protein [Gemmatimonadetes bacterium]|nr:insulinase family protein [Gemmatimonadota bacterium]